MGTRHHTCNITSASGTKGGPNSTDTPLSLSSSFDSDPMGVENYDSVSIQVTPASTSTAVGTIVEVAADIPAFLKYMKVKKIEDILWGVHQSIATRSTGLIAASAVIGPIIPPRSEEHHV